MRSQSGPILLGDCGIESGAHPAASTGLRELLQADFRSRAGRRGKTAIEPGFHGGQWSSRHTRDLFQRELFVEAKNKDFSVVRFKLEENFGYLGGVFAGSELFERRGAGHGDLEGAVVVASFAHLVERGHGALAGEIDDEVAGNGEEPGVEAGLAVVLGSAEEDAHPGLLEEVFGDFALAGEEEQVTQEAVLIELDEVIEQLWILTLEATRDLRALGLSLYGDIRNGHGLRHTI